LKLYLPPIALVVELVDTQDLKSCSPQREYGFDSRLGHLTFRISGRFFFYRKYSDIAAYYYLGMKSPQTGAYPPAFKAGKLPLKQASCL